MRIATRSGTRVPARGSHPRSVQLYVARCGSLDNPRRSSLRNWSVRDYKLRSSARRSATATSPGLARFTGEAMPLMLADGNSSTRNPEALSGIVNFAAISFAFNGRVRYEHVRRGRRASVLDRTFAGTTLANVRGTGFLGANAPPRPPLVTEFTICPATKMSASNSRF